MLKGLTGERHLKNDIMHVHVFRGVTACHEFEQNLLVAVANDENLAHSSSSQLSHDLHKTLGVQDRSFFP